jgi:hypothetical protein
MHQENSNSNNSINHNERTIQHHEMLKQLEMITSDHEKRIRWLERVAFYACGAALVAKFLWDIYSQAKGTKV